MIQNLLPKSEKDNILKAYKARVLITYLLGSFVTLIISCVVFLPPFILSYYKMNAIIQKQNLAPLSAEDEKKILNFPGMVDAESKIALSLKGGISITDRITQISEARPKGLSITEVSYDSVAKTAGKLVKQILISGIAPTRGSLLTFEDQVKKINFVSSISVPVSDLAKDKDLPFSMTIIMQDK